MTRTPEQIALAQHTLAHIEAHPETWDQSTWRCGTSMCFAGWAVTLAGRTWAYDADATAAASWLIATEEDPTDRIWDPLDLDHGGPQVIDCMSVAQRLLGLGAGEADHLFFGASPLHRIKAYVANLAAGRDIDDGLGFEETGHA